MFANSQRPPPCSMDGHSLGGSCAAELEAVLAIPDSPAQYADNPLVLAICAVVSERGSWVGTAAELLEAAHQEGRLIGATPQQVDHAVENLEFLLLDFDGLKHLTLKGNPEEAVRHVFLRE